MNGAVFQTLTDAYYRAHRAYGLMSGLLLAWALVGIDLTDAPVESVKVTFKTPQAAPYVLAVLVLYFGFRVSIEWFQCPPAARERRAARVDFVVAHILGVSAVLLYIAQARFRFQLATTKFGAYAAPGLFGILAAFGLAELWRYHREGQTDRLRLAVYLILAIAPIIFGVVFAVTATFWLVAVVFGAGGAVGAVTWSLLRRLL